MKKYVKSGVQLPSYYVGVVFYDGEPIGCLSNMKEPCSIFVQLDLADVTKAHGVAVGTKRSIEAKARYIINDKITMLYILDNRRVIGEYTDASEPFAYWTSRGVHSAVADNCPRVDLVGHITIAAVPADEDMEFVDTSFVFSNSLPSIDQAIEYYEDIKAIEGPKRFLKYLFKHENPADIEQKGMLYFLNKYDTFAYDIKKWANEYDLWDEYNVPSELREAIESIELRP